jgi:hypothetical protein
VSLLIAARLRRQSGGFPAGSGLRSGSPRSGSASTWGIDGISLWLVLLTTFLMPVTLLSPQAIGIRNMKVREFVVAMLVLEAGMIGAFLALDLFVFYVFWELMLIPMYFIIGIWGGERRLYAAIKFVIYTLVGSLLMLVRSSTCTAVARRQRQLQLRLHQHLAPDAAVRAADALLRGVRAGVRDQGADLPAAHLAARRARRGADRRLGHPGRRPAEVRHLRLHPLRAAVVPAGGGGAAPLIARCRSSASCTAR